VRGQSAALRSTEYRACVSIARYEASKHCAAKGVRSAYPAPDERSEDGAMRSPKGVVRGQSAALRSTEYRACVSIARYEASKHCAAKGARSAFKEPAKRVE